MRGESTARPPKLRLSTEMPSHSPIVSQFQGKLTSQVRRVLPAYLAVVFLLLFFANTHFFTTPIRAAHKYRKELKYQQPLVASTTLIPKKIWQMWKVGPLGFEQHHSDSAKTWPAKNPTYRYEVLTDDNAFEYLEWHYGTQGLRRLDLIELYREINITIVRADLLRYLVMYAEGGVYTDVSVAARLGGHGANVPQIDVECLRPIDRFIPERYNKEEVDMIIGVEIDEVSDPCTGGVRDVD
jgi:mannosyltransferase OCH1-like enzyme